MNKIEKFLRKLSPVERKAVLLIVKQLILDFRKLPNVKKLSGFSNLYRIRVSNYRIIFQVENETATVIRIVKRDDSSYKNLY